MIIRGNAAHLPLADETVQCVITSIPYWGLRAYHGLPAQKWGGTTGSSWHNHENDLMLGNRKAKGENFATYRKETVAWHATCQCNAGTRPNLVLDPFLGSATSGVVAEQLGRRWVGVELSPDYINIAKARTRQRSLFISAEVSV